MKMWQSDYVIYPSRRAHVDGSVERYHGVNLKHD
jgi:hypothetical protein